MFEHKYQYILFVNCYVGVCTQRRCGKNILLSTDSCLFIWVDSQGKHGSPGCKLSTVVQVHRATLACHCKQTNTHQNQYFSVTKPSNHDFNEVSILNMRWEIPICRTIIGSRYKIL